MSDRSDPRTLLERLIQESDRTVEEHCENFQRRARELHERGATLSVRQLARWMAGQVDNARPASRRVAKELWGYSFKALLGSPDAGRGGTVQVVEVPRTATIVSGVGTPAAIDVVPISLQEEIAMAADDAARFARRAGVSINSELIEQFDSDVRKLAVDYLRRPPYAVFRPLAALRREIFDAVDRHPRPEFLSDLYRVGGRVSALLAHASSDLGHLYAADSHARTAWICADLAEDRPFGAYVRWVQSHIAYWRGDYDDAVQIAQSGRVVSAYPDDNLRLLSQEARAYAAMRDERGANRALVSAADIRAQLAGEPGSAAGVFHFGPGKAAYYSSEARLSLGGDTNIRGAVRDAEEALVLLSSSPARDNSVELVAAARLDLTSALLATNDLDAAIEQISGALELPTENRTVPIVGRASDIYDALGGQVFVGVAQAEEVRERISLFQAYPAARELP